jgi:hypothetical protein
VFQPAGAVDGRRLRQFLPSWRVPVLRKPFAPERLVGTVGELIGRD